MQMTFNILPPRHLFHLDAFHYPSLSCVFAWLSRYSEENLMFFVCISMPSYSLSFASKRFFALFEKGPACNKFHILPKENLASASHSKTYVPYSNMALQYLNSSTYGWFLHWTLNLSTLCEFSIKWSNSSSSAIHTCHLSMLVVIMVFITCSPGKVKIFYNPKRL